MEHVCAGKLDSTEAATLADSACPSAQGGDISTKQETSKEDFPASHKVTGSQSSIDHDKSDTKRNAGHRSKSFLEEPVRSKAASFMQAKHGDTSTNRSTHGSHGDGITAPNLGSKGLPVNETTNRTSDQHKIFETENSETFTPTSTGSTQKLFDSEVTFADLVRVSSAPATKTEPAKPQVGNVLLSTPHAGTLVSNYLNSYRCYLAHLRHSGVVSCSLQDRTKPQLTPVSNVPLVLPLTRMTPVFTDDSHNDPEFIDLLKKTTTESIRNLWPCRGKTNIFTKSEYAKSSGGDLPKPQESNQLTSAETSEVLPSSEFVDSDQTGVCSQQEGNYNNQNFGKEEADISFSQNTLQDICQLIDADNVSCDSLRDLDSGMTFLGESGEILYDLDNSEQLLNKELSPRDNSNIDMVKTLTDNVHSFPSTVPSCQTQTSSNCWSDASQDTDCDAKLSHNKTCHLNKLLQLQLQQKLMHHQQMQRQLMHQQQQEQRQHLQQQQQNQMYSDQHLFQQFQPQQQPQQQQLQEQPKEQQLDPLKAEKKQFSVDARPWYQMNSDGAGSQRAETSKASLSTSTQLATIHTSKSDLATTMTVGMSGFDPCKKKQVASQRFYPGNNTAGFPQSSTGLNSQQSGDNPTQLRTLKASYACLDPQQSNAMLSADQLFGSLRNEGSTKLTKDVSVGQPYSAEPFGETGIILSSEDNNSSCRKSWPNLNSQAPGMSGNDNSQGMHAAKESRWGRSAETNVQERLKRAYVRTMSRDFNQGGAWETGFPSDRNQQVASSKAENEEIFGGGLDSQGLNCQDPSMFYDSLDSSLEPSGVLGFVKDNTPWPHVAEVPNTFDRFDYSTSGCPDRLRDTQSLQGLTPSDQGSRLSRLYQWRCEPDALNGAGCDLSVTTSCSGALVASSQADRDFSWNASSVVSQMDQPENFQNGPICRSMRSPAVGDVTGVFLERDNRVKLGKTHQTSGCNLQQAGEGPGPTMFDDFQESGLDPTRSGAFQQHSMDEKQQHQQHTWSNNGTQSDLINMRNAGAPSLSYGPFLSYSMQVLNNKILSAQNATPVESAPGNRPGNACEINQDGPNQDFSLTCDFSNGRDNSESTSSCSKSLASQQQQKFQQQQQQQQQQQNLKQNSVLSLSDQLEKTYLTDGLTSKPWHELTNEDPNIHDFQPNANGTMQTSLPENSTSFSSHVQSKDKYSGNNSEGSVLKEQGFPGRQVTSSRPRLILGANSMHIQKREHVQTENLEESNRRLREMLGLNHNGEPIGKPAGKGSHLPGMQENLVSQCQISSGMIASNGLPGHVMTTAPISGTATRLQLPHANIQQSQAVNPQMYCVPNILLPPPQAQTPNTSRPSNMVLGGMTPSARFPGMIRVPYVDMSRVVYIQQMPVNVSSSQTSNNNHNNSTSSNPHVNVSNIITINTDKDFSNGGLPDKPGRLVRQNINKTKPTFFKVRSGSEEFAVPILGMRTPVEDRGCTRQIKPRTNPWDQDLDQDFNSSLLSKAKTVDQQVPGLGNIPPVSECVGGTGEQGKTAGVGTVLGAGVSGPGSGSAGTSSVTDPNLQMATYMQWPASADMHPEMLDMLPVRRAGPEDSGMGGRVCWPDMEFMLTSRDQLQNTRRSNKPMGSNKANLISIIPKGASNDGQVGGIGIGQKDLEIG